jgi:hypothetical protein
LRQIVMRRNDQLMRIPGPWFRAATALAPESLIIRSYRDAAVLAGVEPLQNGVLPAQRSHHVMGLYRRGEVIAASQRTLESIRDAIPSDSVRLRFDQLFRPRGEWIVDLHDAALAWARSRAPDVSWGAAQSALTTTRWAASKASNPEQEELLRGLYGLAVLSANDSAAFARARIGLEGADSASSAAVLVLWQGYIQGQRWYAKAINFFLQEPWIPSGRGQSLADYVRADWRAVVRGELDLPIPRIHTRWFGFPQAVPRYSVPPAFFQHLITGTNASAEDWVQRHGEQGLLRALQRLPDGDTSLTLLQAGSETLRLTTVSRQSRESLNGFLEPQDVIAIDPAYVPLLALGAIVHEWQHLLFRRIQLETYARSHRQVPLQVELPGIQPHLAEGFAEWSAERILAPLTARWPLLGLAELEKRADLVQRGEDDQHAIGYALVRVLAEALKDPAGTTALLMRHAEHPGRISEHPALRRVLRRYREGPDRQLRTPAYGTLIPEVTFTIEDGFPDVIATRILALPAHDESR